MLTYVTQSYDEVQYAGPSKKMALSVKNSTSSVWVWENGKIKGWLMLKNGKYVLK